MRGTIAETRNARAPTQADGCERIERRSEIVVAVLSIPDRYSLPHVVRTIVCGGTIAHRVRSHDEVTVIETIGPDRLGSIENPSARIGAIGRIGGGF